MSSIALFINKLQQRFTYRQRFLFFAAVFFLATPLPDYWTLKEYNALIGFKKHQINGLEYYWQVLKLRKMLEKHESQSTLNIHSAIAQEFSELDKVSPEHQTMVEMSYWDEFNFYAPLYPVLNKILAIFHEYLATDSTVPETNQEAVQIKIKLNQEFFHLAFLSGLLSDPTLPYPYLLKQMLTTQAYSIEPLQLQKDYDALLKTYPKYTKEIEKLRTTNPNSEEWLKESFALIKNVLHKQLRSYEWIHALFIFLLIFVTAIVILFVVLRMLTRHLLKLLEHVESLAKGDFSTRYYPVSDDEFSQVGLTLNNLANVLADIAGRIHSLGGTLTSSSEHLTYEVTTHETSVLDQENSIHMTEEIANKIAIDCRNFVKTISDLSNQAMQEPLMQNTQKNLAGLRQILEEVCIDTHATLNMVQVVKKELLSASGNVSLLGKISEDAHMLGLNASIEANSKGQHNPQFHKITQAIEQFTERTAQARVHIDSILKETSLLIVDAENKIQNCLEELESGKNELQAIHNQLHGIDKQVDSQVEKFDKLNNALKKQAFEAENILDAITHVRKNANDTKEVFRQLHKRVLHLGESARELRHLLQVFFSEPPTNIPYQEGNNKDVS